MARQEVPRCRPPVFQCHLRTMLLLDLPGLSAVQELVGAPAGKLRARWEALDAEQLESEIRKFKEALSQVLGELKRLGEGHFKRDHFLRWV